MKQSYILYYGILAGYFVGFLTSLIQAYRNFNSDLIVWPFLKVSVVFFLFKFFLDRIKEDAVSSKIGWILLVGNLINVAIALWFVLLPFNNSWYANSTGPLGVALGIPSLLALYYYNK